MNSNETPTDNISKEIIFKDLVKFKKKGSQIEFISVIKFHLMMKNSYENIWDMIQKSHFSNIKDQFAKIAKLSCLKMALNLENQIKLKI